MRLRSALAIAALGAACLTSAGHAATVNQPLPTNAYIVQNGLDWAWASPLPGADLSYQSAFGWRLPTASELLHVPLATDFLFAGANTPFGGFDAVGDHFDLVDQTYYDAASAGACAAVYFSNASWCDWINGHGDFAGAPGASSNADQLVVRTAIAAVTPIPPALPLFSTAIVGMVGLGWKRRRRAA